jgi:hypothetical protein
MKTVISLVVLWTFSWCPNIGCAQTSTHAVLTVKVPFEFVVGNQSFPAGTYKFQSLLNSVPGKDTIDVLTVRSTEGRLYQAIVTSVADSAAQSAPRLVFTHNEGRTELSEVWEPGKRGGCRIENRKRTERTQTAQSDDEKVILLASTDWR